MSKSSELFIALREQEQARELAELDYQSYLETIYTKGKQPAQSAINTKNNGNSSNKRSKGK